MANPNPEATYADMKAAGVPPYGTGRSDAPNQINVAVFLVSSAVLSTFVHLKSLTK